MIEAVIVDLDGTLVETEHLKALSYAGAAVELCPSCATEEQVVNAFKDLVGKSRHEVAQGLVERFGLEESARSRMSEFGVSAPRQAYVQIRLRMFAVPTDFTRDAVEKANVLDPKWIVDEPLESVFKRMLAEQETR